MSPIPQPKTIPIIGNIPDIDINAPVQSLMKLGRVFGPIFRLKFPTQDVIVVGSHELVNELCDEKRFDKKLHGPLKQLRHIGGDGLFTAETQELNWEKAHRLLVPAFGPVSIRDMFEEMFDVSEQMMLRWERFGESTPIDVPDHFTRLTLDTIALCAFDYRFNSFYQNEMHPFVGAMTRALAESGARPTRLPIQNRLMLLTQKQYESDIRYMHGIVDQLIAKRKQQPFTEGKMNLLDRMLSAKDPVTGERLSDENIRYQMVTFLIAGHETTSGLLSFALYGLLKNPQVLNRARLEVETVLGNETIRAEHLSKLTYLEQVLKETLRIWPTAPAFALTPREDTVVGGKHSMKKGDEIIVLLPQLHRDPKVWGKDAEKFDPSRFETAAFNQLPSNAWKPFGNGLRACIGRAFAMQEAQIALAMILQRFELFEADPSYQLKIKETLTMKPDGFYVRVRKRPFTRSRVIPKTVQEIKPAPVFETTAKTPILILYGSNSGTCETFAQKIAADMKSQGFMATMAELDSYAGQLPSEGPVVIVTSSYEGQPTDNARKFVAWLDTLGANSLDRVSFAVFGCGNRDWASTYQAVPQKIDQKLYQAGARRLCDRGEADARGDFFGDFDRWYSSFSKVLSDKFNRDFSHIADAPMYSVEVVKENKSSLLKQSDLQQGMVVENRELVNMIAPFARSKRHLEIALPEGISYRSGDYLTVLPINSRESVNRVLHRFGFGEDTQIIIRQSIGTESSLPTAYPILVSEILSHYVELLQPATRKQIQFLAQLTQCPPEKNKLMELLQEEQYLKMVLEKRVSVLDLLERFASCTIPFSTFLEFLPPMRPRQYSISSSPLWNENHCTLTLSVVNGPAWSGQGRFSGVTSGYLSNITTGTRISVSTRRSNAGFHLPSELETPVIMVAAGSGIAPFRGFVQERAFQMANGRNVGAGLLFFGCDHPDVDYLYREEFHAWEKAGVVRVRTAFSEMPEGDIQFVQHRLWQDRGDVMALMEKNAKIFVCGSGRTMAPAVRETFVQIYREFARCSVGEAERWIHDLEKTSSRYVSDVFG